MRPPPEPVVTDRRLQFTCPPDVVWAALTATDRYPTWWPWLKEFDGTGVSQGSTWRCAVRSPLGYTVRFNIALEAVDPPNCVQACVSGDIEGTASIALAPSAAGPGADSAPGARLQLTSQLVPVRPLLRHLTRLAPAIARWGHDRILASGIDSFRTHAFHDR
ncbi:MAG: hypothetical protein EA389_06610 [Ilumatobacter sp.]|nr:MAG: hypothetical protein EA389_06610 [Ilumatobacter sp.]